MIDYFDIWQMNGTWKKRDHDSTIEIIILIYLYIIISMDSTHRTKKLRALFDLYRFISKWVNMWPTTIILHDSLLKCKMSISRPIVCQILQVFYVFNVLPNLASLVSIFGDYECRDHLKWQLNVHKIDH